MKKLSTLFLIIILFFLSACTIPGTSKTPSGSNSETQESESANDFQLQSIEGNTVKLSDFKGKPVVINFLTTWCGYCSQELPHFLSLKEEYGDEIEFLFVDVQESSSEVKAYRDKKGYDNYVPLLDSDGSVAAVYGISAFPTTIFVNKAGDIAEIHRGMMAEDMLKKAVEEVKNAD